MCVQEKGEKERREGMKERSLKKGTPEKEPTRACDTLPPPQVFGKRKGWRKEGRMKRERRGRERRRGEEKRRKARRSTRPHEPPAPLERVGFA